MTVVPNPLVAGYRKQQGGLQGGSDLQGADPVVVGWIVKAAQATHSDPVVELATSLQETGARRGRVGDSGTSYGPFQHHVGGALGSHSPAWANSYEAVLERARQFARYGVHGGKGAAAVQRPADRLGYARGVDSLEARASAILAAYGIRPGRDPQAQVKTLSKSLPKPEASSVGSYISGGSSAANASNRLLGLPSMPSLDVFVPGVSAPATGPPTRSAAPAALPSSQATAPSRDWGGSKGVALQFLKLGLANGLKVASEKRSRRMTASGGVSDHWVGSKSSYAYDLSNGSAPTPQMDAAAAQIAAALGVKGWKGGVLNVNRGGYRIQVLYRTNVGGNHYDHVHVGVRRIGR